MKLILGILLLALSTSGFAAPRPQSPSTAVVLRDGTHAVIKNGQLLLVGPGGKQSPAPPGPYVTRDGKQLTVESNGRLSSSESPSNPAPRRNEPGPSVAPTRSDPSKGPTIAPTPVTSVAPNRSDTVKAPPPHETANDMANATKTQDAVLKALYEITVRLQTMEAKQNGQLQAVEAKQKALEDQLKTLQSFTTQVKNEILAAIAKNSVPPEKFVTILSHLTEIRKATDGLPRPGWEKGGLDKPGDFWRWIYADVESTKEGIALLIKNQ